MSTTSINVHTRGRETEVEVKKYRNFVCVGLKIGDEFEISIFVRDLAEAKELIRKCRDVLVSHETLPEPQVPYRLLLPGRL